MSKMFFFYFRTYPISNNPVMFHQAHSIFYITSTPYFYSRFIQCDMLYTAKTLDLSLLWYFIHVVLSQFDSFKCSSAFICSIIDGFLVYHDSYLQVYQQVINVLVRSTVEVLYQYFPASFLLLSTTPPSP